MIDEYIKRYGKRLYGLCISLCMNRFDADDLYQETWLKVCSKIEKYDEKRPFEAWLTQVCVNSYRDLLRKKKRSPMYDEFTCTEEKDVIINNIRTSEKEDYSEVHNAITQLPDKLRVTVILFYFYGMSERQTAQVLAIPVGTVKSRLNKAKKLLKGVLLYEADIQLREV